MTVLLLVGVLASVWAQPGHASQRSISSARALTEQAPLYSSASPWNQPVPIAPDIDPNSAAMVAGLAAARAEKGFPVAIEDWTVPVYFADAGTPRYTVTLRQAPPQWTNAYGTPNDFVAAPPGWLTDPTTWSPRIGLPRASDPTALRDVPIPLGAQPDPELDGHMTVIDARGGCEYDLYAAHREEGAWTAVWGNSTPIDGSGVYPRGLSSKASGFAGAAGLIFPEELRSGHIDHALFMAFPFTKAGGPVPPATSSDGRTGGDYAIPIGARIQLDPSLDLNALELKPYERTVARALQRYGMIVGDTGGAMSLYAASPQSYRKNPYAGLLPDSAYAYLDHIPVDRFRVIKLLPQRPSLSLGIQSDGCSKPS